MFIGRRAVFVYNIVTDGESSSLGRQNVLRRCLCCCRSTFETFFFLFFVPRPTFGGGMFGLVTFTQQHFFFFRYVTIIVYERYGVVLVSVSQKKQRHFCLGLLSRSVDVYIVDSCFLCVLFERRTYVCTHSTFLRVCLPSLLICFFFSAD